MAKKAEAIGVDHQRQAVPDKETAAPPPHPVWPWETTRGKQCRIKRRRKCSK
jgi:hypothetical protein